MLLKLFTVISLFSLCCYLYGILFTITNSEPNACKMTYMFEYPQFVKIHFPENDNFPKYNLYAYSEGRLTENARNMNFNGAPVIFVPGNKGSHKQGRSFASVALRKGIDNNWMRHLDYFTIDYNEEYLALFGGYFEDQTKYLSHCIEAVLNLYRKLPNRPKRVVLIAHSMGGKIVQSVATIDKISNLINTIVLLSTPIDRPVINIDFYFEAFYRKINQFWEDNKEIHRITNQTNTCQVNYPCRKLSTEKDLQTLDNKLERRRLDRILMVTIGGGDRDILVDSGLTTSKFSDIHAMSSSIPNVWLSTDHLSAVWCLQQVIVINRFLYSLIAPLAGNNARYHQGLDFINDKPKQLQLAKQYLTQEKCPNKPNEMVIVNEADDDIGEWIEDSRRVFNEQFKTGLKRARYQMIRLVDSAQNQMLSVEAISLETDDWVFGCAALDIGENMRFCKKATSLSYLVKKIPSQLYDRLYLSIDLHQIMKEHPTWTHIILRILPTKKPLQLNIDIHNPYDRKLITQIPKWYSNSPINLLADTMHGTVSYTVEISGLSESFKVIELSVRKNSCSKREHHAVARLCVPWTRGFERFHHFTDQNSTPMNVYVPMSKPIGYNTTVNPVRIEMILDPSCRYTISIKNNFGMTLSRIVLQYSHWIPAHLVAIILLAMKHQLSLTPPREPFKCGSLHSGLLNSSSFFIVTASKVFVKLVLWMKFLPIPDPYEYSLLISTVIHGSAFALLTLATVGVWFGICLCGNIAYKILIKLIQWPIPTISSGLMTMIEKFPLGLAAVLIAIGTATCGGLALVCAVAIYFTMLTKMYEEYLQEFIFKTAKLIATKLFGSSDESEAEIEASETAAICNDIKENDAEIVKDENQLVKSTDGNQINSTTDESTIDNLAEQNEDENLTEEEKQNNEELDKLLKETWEMQRKSQLERAKEMAHQRAEYDGIHEAISTINFHLSLFFLLVILAGLNIPSVLTWAKNYQYNQTLKFDPSFFSSVATLLALSFIWQFKTPKNIQGYQTMANVLYLLACICILYCQDSVYRLNAIVSTVFVMVALHQILILEYIIPPSLENPNFPAEFTNRIELLKEELNQNIPPTTQPNEN